MIRVSREQCGCSCVGQCLPGSCLCLELGIECQVRTATFCDNNDSNNND